MVLMLNSNPLFGGIMLGQGIDVIAIGGTDFTNYGHITTLVGSGVFVDGGNNVLRNFGTIDLTIGTFRYGSADQTHC